MSLTYRSCWFISRWVFKELIPFLLRLDNDGVLSFVIGMDNFPTNDSEYFLRSKYFKLSVIVSFVS